MLTEVWPFVDAHRRAGRPVVLARLVGRDGPGARPLGATMAVAADGTWRGSPSGGCGEGIVLDAAIALTRAGCRWRVGRGRRWMTSEPLWHGGGVAVCGQPSWETTA